MKPKEYKFFVYFGGEKAAGRMAFDDTVRITVESGDPGGVPGEFEEEMCEFLKYWYDADSVELIGDPKL